MKAISLMGLIRLARRPQKIKNTFFMNSRQTGSKVISTNVNTVLLRRQTLNLYKIANRSISNKLVFTESIFIGCLDNRLFVDKPIFIQSINLIRSRIFNTDNLLYLNQIITIKKSKLRTIVSTYNLSAGIPQKIKGSKKGKVKIGNNWIDVNIDI